MLDNLTKNFDGSNFENFAEPTITIRGKTLTQKDINNENVMPMAWFQSLSPREREEIATFDHEHATMGKAYKDDDMPVGGYPKRTQ
jgi:hypothetical protein